MLSEKQYLDLINAHIARLQLQGEPAGLYRPIAYTLDGSGKRLRPVLLLICADACGGSHTDAIDQAMGIEMFHNFTLLHDDVMDRSDMRRGRPTVHRKWDERTAILSGDAMLTLATMLVGKCSPAMMPDILGLFNTTAMEIYEGQQYDMDFEQRDDVTVAEYMEMIRLKTSVLLGCACAMGAMTAGASDSTRKALYDYGVALGLAFQLQDDWLDTFGSPEIFGKNIGGDILNDKKTYLRITAMERADKATLDQIMSLNGSRHPDKVATISAMYVRLGAEASCRELIDRYAAEAIKTLDNADIDPEARRMLADMAMASTHRSK